MNQKVFSFFLIIFFSSLSLFSQVNIKAGVNIGGLTSSLRGIEYGPDANFKVTPLVGFNIELSLSPAISIVSGINFERWKMERDFSYHNGYGGNYSVESTEGYDFFNVPLLFRYKFGGKKDFFIDAGAFMNYFNKGRPNGPLSLFIIFEDYNFGPALGFGKDFKLNDKLAVTVQLRDELGLTDISKYETWVNADNVMTNTIRLIATFSLEL